MTIAATLDAERVDAFNGALTGTVLRPGDERYEAARLVHNGLIDRRPALIARCRGTGDVAAAVRFAREKTSRSPSAAAATTRPDAPSPTAG